MNENRASDFEKVFDVIIAFYKERDYFDLLDSILAKMMDITNADGGTLYVVEEGKLEFRIMRNLSKNIYLTAKDKIQFDSILLDRKNVQNISAYAALNNEIVSIDDVYNNQEFLFEGPKKFDRENDYHAKSMLVFPLTATGSNKLKLPRVIGVIQLINSIDPQTGEVRSFGDIFDPPVLPALSNISANALANILYVQEIQKLFASFVRVMTKAIDERSEYSVNHTNNVGKYCDDFAQYLGQHFEEGHPLHFDDNRREQLVMAAYLHDIGKIITPLDVMDKAERLGPRLPILRLSLQLKMQQLENKYLKGELNKEEYQKQIEEVRCDEARMEFNNTAKLLTDEDIQAAKNLANVTYMDATGQEVRLFSDLDIQYLSIRSGTLTEEERQIMKDHVCVTQRLLEQMAFNEYYKDVPVWASNHHEFLDGSGYPNGLHGEQICVEESILAMVDVFEALTARDRPYKKSISVQAAIKILLDMVEEGKLPKDIVELFIKSRMEAGLDHLDCER